MLHRNQYPNEFVNFYSGGTNFATEPNFDLNVFLWRWNNDFYHGKQNSQKFIYLHRSSFLKEKILRIKRCWGPSSHEFLFLSGSIWPSYTMRINDLIHFNILKVIVSTRKNRICIFHFNDLYHFNSTSIGTLRSRSSQIGIRWLYFENIGCLELWVESTSHKKKLIDTVTS